MILMANTEKKEKEKKRMRIRHNCGKGFKEPYEWTPTQNKVPKSCPRCKVYLKPGNHEVLN